LPKKKADKPQRPFTRHQISRWEQQRRREHIILGVGISVIIIALAFIGAGWYIGRYQPLHETVLVVNDREFSMAYFVEMLKLQAGEGQTEAQLLYLADSVEPTIQRSELIRQKARELGVTISSEEAKLELQNNDLPDTEVYLDLAKSKLVYDRLMSGYFDDQVPLYDRQRQVMAMLLESENQAEKIQGRIESGDNFTDLAKELSLEDYTKANGGDFNWAPQRLLEKLLDASSAQKIFSLPVGTLQIVYDEEVEKPVGYWLVEVLDRNEEESETHLQVMLLSSEAQALEIKNRLEAGEDFGTLAMEYSQLKGVEENKGEFMVAEGMMQPAVDEYAFSPDTKLGELSEPIRDDTVYTKEGYWLVKVDAEDENRRIDTKYRDFLKAQAFNEWVATILDDPDNQLSSYLDDEKKAWAVAQVMRG
jgi:parvulin-like peptidyl-prolyl isomerase